MTENNNGESLVRMKEMIRHKLLHLAAYAESHSSVSTEEYMSIQLEITLDMMLQVHALSDISECLNLVEQAGDLFSTNLCEDRNSGLSCPQLVKTGLVGRPAFDIPQEVLEFYLGNNFKIKDITLLLNVSEKTVKRRLQEYNLRVSDTYSQIDDEELKELVSNFITEFPCLGYRSMLSLLLNAGHRVQERRVRRAMKLADPEGVLFRRLFLSSHRIQRRGYYVRCPQALWHIDGNHKLIRWRFVIHGGIDGYSRLPVFLRVCTNNRSSSVLEAFVNAVKEYGLPEKVRSDKGKENVLVAEYMLKERGVNSKPFITGRSVHNQRIERLWREVWSGCSVIFYQIFHQMEEDGILQIDNETHLAILHLVFEHRIQHHLDVFRNALSRRPLRTERNKTPWQLWISGYVNDAQIMMDPISEVELDYGASLEEINLTRWEHVEVPDTVSLQDADLAAINDILCRDSDLFGVDIYRDIMTMIG